ncbi:MAG: hypothetical protein AAGJ79_05410, partial [Verrucomicrobiota bacterium]
MSWTRALRNFLIPGARQQNAERKRWRAERLKLRAQRDKAIDERKRAKDRLECWKKACGYYKPGNFH